MSQNLASKAPPLVAGEKKRPGTQRVLSRSVRVKPRTVPKPGREAGHPSLPKVSRSEAQPPRGRKDVMGAPEVERAPNLVQAPENPSPPSRPRAEERKATFSLGPSYPKAVAVERAPRRPSGKSPVPKAKGEQTVAVPVTPRGWGPVGPAKGRASGGGEGGQKSGVTRRARLKKRPRFNLTKRFPELASATILAEFKIAEDGSFEVVLIKGSGNLTADVSIEARLRECVWLPAMDKGVPIKDIQRPDFSLDS